ncbi:DUF6580 family putative transport protein [Frigoriglobus tundricola]|uniref:Uncharacterized protein n=1 Tax=Frigoriglobus tundricola TaxID=2774151 RepID=A0A6M5YKR0_9BACT|nr:DUF6580 family putative transport protein [Frigoriglobus tundricola]QJW94558.1 hypothetical protein FTUN_2079 [Frigoriglobus tundricola]
MDSQPHKPMTLALAGVALALVVAQTVLFAQLPPEYRVWNASVIGALALFTAARLGFWHGVGLTAAAIALKDLCLYLTTDWWQPYPLSWVYFTVYVLIGWAFLRHSASVGRAVATGFGAGLVFFFVSNFVSWLEQALPQYEHSFRGLVDCYVAAIPFYRGTFIGDTAFSAALFGAHAVLSRAYFPAERAAAVAANRSE